MNQATSDTLSLISKYIFPTGAIFDKLFIASLERKRKKQLHKNDQIRTNDPFLFDLVSINQLNPSSRIIRDEAIQAMEGNTHSKKLELIQHPNDEFFEEIEKYRNITKMIIKSSSNFEQVNIQEINDKVTRKMTINQTQKLFSKELEDNQLNQLLEKNDLQIQQTKEKIRSYNQQMYEDQLQIRFLQLSSLLFNHMESFDFQNQMQEVLKSQKLFDNQEKDDNILIEIKLKNNQITISNLLKIRNNEQQNENRIYWENQKNFLRREEETVVSSVINGQFLLKLEENENQIKSRMIPIDTFREIEYRRCNWRESEVFGKKQQTIIRQHKTVAPSFEKPRNDYHNKTKTQQIDNFFTQNRSNIKNKTSNNQPKGRNSNYSRSKFSQLNDFSYENYSKIQHKEEAHRNQRQSPISKLQKHMQQSSYRKKKEVHIQKKLKYPLKLSENLIVKEPKDSFILYSLEDISLPNVPVQFMKDRLKYNQNHVKIQYPPTLTPQLTTTLSRTFVILNSLGSIFYSDYLNSYMKYEELPDGDDAMILFTASYLEINVGIALELYQQFIGVQQMK